MNPESFSTTSMRAGINAAEVSLGWLLSPDELALECATTIQRPTYNSWAVGIHLPDAVVRVMQSELVPVGTGLALFSSENGPVYPVVIFQSGATQVRAMLSLADQRTQKWFTETATTGRMRLAIEIPETGQLAVAQGQCQSRSRAEVEEQIRRCVRLDGEERLFDEFQLATKLAKVGTVKSLVPGFEVQEVRLILVLPDGGIRAEIQEATSECGVIH